VQQCMLSGRPVLNTHACRTFVSQVGFVTVAIQVQLLATAGNCDSWNSGAAAEGTVFVAPAYVCCAAVGPLE
jgi:hypothetical protein